MSNDVVAELERVRKELHAYRDCFRGVGMSGAYEEGFEDVVHFMDWRIRAAIERAKGETER